MGIPAMRVTPINAARPERGDRRGTMSGGLPKNGEFRVERSGADRKIVHPKKGLRTSPVCLGRTCDPGMIKVKARGNESIHQMLKRFKKMCEKEGLTRDIKRNSYYEKPSERRRRQKRKSIKRVASD